jgi:hypothetical protein
MIHAGIMPTFSSRFVSSPKKMSDRKIRFTGYEKAPISRHEFITSNVKGSTFYINRDMHMHFAMQSKKQK